MLVREIDGRWHVLIGVLAHGRWCLLEGETLTAGLRNLFFVMEGAAPALIEWRKFESLPLEVQERFPVLERITIDRLVVPHPDLIRYLRDLARERMKWIAAIPARRRRAA